MIINNTICFIHIPKAGGSTIEHLLIQNENNYINYIILIIIEFIYDIIKNYASVLYYIFSNHNDGLLRTINDYFLDNYHSSYIDYKKKYESYESYSNTNTKNINIKYFSCVRHPQSRLVSLYTFLKPPINFDTFVIQLLSKKNNDINNNDINNKTNKKNTYPPQISYQEQSLFLCDKFNKLCVPYIKIENINTDWKKMCNYLNISNYKNDSNKNTIPYKNVSDTNTNNNNSMNWKLYYDRYPHIINYVKDYYKNDFINFNYDIYYPNI
jgi:hypothetical protein